MTDQLDRNKRNAQAFYDLMFNQCRPADAVEQFVGDTYTQHNPAVADGKQAFIDYLRPMNRRPQLIRDDRRLTASRAVQRTPSRRS